MIIYTLGPAGTFSHEAVQQIFPDADVRFEPNFDAVFAALSKHPEAVGVVPIENSLHGSVDEILDLLRESEVKIWRMHEVAIRHSFGAKNPKAVTKIASHSQALRQCRKWLREQYPNAEHLPTTSTAAAVKLAGSDDSVGAIGSEKLIRTSNLKLVDTDIEGDANTTRFAIVSVNDPFPGSMRTRMSIGLHPHPHEDRPGFLHMLLTPFKVYDLNMSRIENRPTGKKLGDYNFFIDFVGSPDDPRTQKALEDLAKLAEIQILGVW
jgi:prephenate dehydratase